MSSIDQAGNIQVQHPGGLTLRIGTPAIEDISTVAADGNWSIPAGAPPTITLQTGKFSLVVDAATGNISVHTTGDAKVAADGNASVTAGGTASVLAPAVQLGVTGGKRIVCDGDPVVGGGGGHVEATQTRVFAG